MVHIPCAAAAGVDAAVADTGVAVGNHTWNSQN